jgi:hypothetical protein
MIFGFISARFIINRRDHKETLNIWKSNDTIYFMLSDDDFAKVNLKNKDDTQVVIDVVNFEMPTLKNLVDRIILQISKMIL